MASMLYCVALNLYHGRLSSNAIHLVVMFNFKDNFVVKKYSHEVLPKKYLMKIGCGPESLSMIAFIGVVYS